MMLSMSVERTSGLLLTGDAKASDPKREPKFHGRTRLTLILPAVTVLSCGVRLQPHIYPSLPHTNSSTTPPRLHFFLFVFLIINVKVTDFISNPLPAITMAPQQATPPPPGVYVPVPTFFSSSSKDAAAVSKLYKNRIATDIQAAHSIHLAKSGIKGLVLLGSTGESIHLQPAERTTLISSVREALDDADFKKYPIIVGVLTNSIEDAIEQLQSAKEAGGDYGLVLAPGYFGAGVAQEGIVEWYKTVADASPMPILL